MLQLTPSEKNNSHANKLPREKSMSLVNDVSEVKIINFLQTSNQRKYTVKLTPQEYDLEFGFCPQRRVLTEPG